MRKTPVVPRLITAVESPDMLTVAALELTRPVPPPTWNVPPLAVTAKLPPPVKLTSVVVAAALLFDPSVTPPLTVNVLPMLTVTVLAAAFFTLSTNEAIV